MRVNWATRFGEFWTQMDVKTKNRSQRYSLTPALSIRNWLRGLDLNQRPSGYEPDELPGCSTPQMHDSGSEGVRQTRRLERGKNVLVMQAAVLRGGISCAVLEMNNVSMIVSNRNKKAGNHSSVRRAAPSTLGLANLSCKPRREAVDTCGDR